MKPPSITVGNVAIEAVSDGILETSVEFILGIDAAIAKERIQPDSQGRFSIPVNNFLIRQGETTVIIDAGAGPTMGTQLGKLPENLAAAGVQASDITHVVLTHIHPDHSNGLVTDTGQAVFPNAQLVVHEAEVDFWLGEPLVGEPEIFKFSRSRAQWNLAPYMNRLIRAREGEEIVGLTPMLAAGHTPGHTMWFGGSGSNRFVAWGDIVHVSALQVMHPEAGVRFDFDQDRARETRKWAFDMLANERVAILGAHVAAPGFGLVTRKGANYSIESIS